MANNQITIDPSADSQVIDQPNRRTIYDAGMGEIFMKSFVAGIGLGIGRMVATLIFFGIIAGLFVTYLEPWLMSFMNQLQNIFPSYLVPASANTETSRFQYSEDQFLDIFNTFRPTPAPVESTTTTDTTDTTTL